MATPRTSSTTRKKAASPKRPAARRTREDVWTPKPWVHPDQREVEARAVRKRVPRSSHGAFELQPGRDPIAILEAPGGRPSPGPRPAPPRADGGVAVRVLPRYARRHGIRPRETPTHRHHGPGERRRAPLELRLLRLARADAGVRCRTTSTRRCRRHGNGMSSGSLRASSSPAAPTDSAPAQNRRGRRWPPCAPIASGWPAMRRCASWRSCTRDHGRGHPGQGVEAAAAQGPERRGRVKRLDALFAKARGRDAAQGGELPDGDRRRPARDPSTTRRS